MTAKGPEDARIGSILAERYRIDALIGEGGMGRVYSAEHVMMKKRLAVKVLRRELTVVPEVVARFEREAMAAANIDHENVAAATDFGKLPDGSVYLVLEFVLGSSLRDEIAEGPLPLRRALHITRQIASGLAAAHLQGIVHRDLKPENVMLVERGSDRDFVKVLDFGIAKVPIGEVPQSAPKDQPITKAGMVFGTPEYMSPEQALGQAVDGRADLYSLGVILFEMLAGARPFSSANPVGILGQQLANPPPSLNERAPDAEIPPAVEQLVTRLMQRDREARFAKATDLVRAIDVLLSPTPSGRHSFDQAPSPAPAPRPAPAPAPKHEDAEDLAPHSEPGPPARGGLFQAAMSSVVPPAEALRERLPVRLRESLRPVETRTLLAIISVAGLIVLGLLVATVSVVLGRSSEPVPISAAAPKTAPTPPAPSAPAAAPTPARVDSAPPPVPANRALPAELEVAARQGAPALEQLASKYPLDPEPLIEAARAWVTAKDYVRATGAIGRTLALDANLNRDDRVATVLYQSAQDRAAADAAFALLQGPMATRGAEIQWDLAAEPAVKAWVRTRAGQWLRSPEFRRLAPPSLTLAADLRTAASCDAARALLPKAKELGDERSLTQLEAWQRTTGCGKAKTQDCMPCLRKDAALDDAVRAIQQRKKPG